MSKIRITQVKSRIGSTKRQKDTLVALGLTKTGQMVEKTVSPQILGMVKKLEHLLKIETVQ